VKSQQDTISTEEKLDVISQTDRGEWTSDISCNVRVTHSSVRTICDNAGRITESAKLGMKVFVLQDYHSPITMKSTKNYGHESLTFLLHLK